MEAAVTCGALPQVFHPHTLPSPTFDGGAFCVIGNCARQPVLHYYARCVRTARRKVHMGNALLWAAVGVLFVIAALAVLAV